MENEMITAEQIVDRLIEDGCQNEIFQSIYASNLGKKFLKDVELSGGWKDHDGNLARDVRIYGRQFDFTDDEFYMLVDDFMEQLNEGLKSEYGIEAGLGGRSGGWLEISAKDTGTLVQKDAEDGKIVVSDMESFRAALLKFVEEMMDWYAAELAGEQKFDAIGEDVYDAFVNQLYFDMEDRELYEDIDLSWFKFPTIDKVMAEIDEDVESTLDMWEREGKGLFGE